MNLDIKLGISLLVCAVAIGVSALLLAAPSQPDYQKTTEVKN